MTSANFSPTDQVIGVKEFVSILNETLTFAYPSVTLEGEVSSYKVSQGRWVFFDLKEAEVTMGCFMPLASLKVALEDGMRVRVTGSPKLTNWGKFSFTVRSVTLAGEGELKRAFELLKARLSAEGLFEPARKRPLPPYPKSIGLITSSTSAAYADFMKILGARWGGLDIQLADVAVQGQSAEDQIIGALNYFNQAAAAPDVLVLIRGGGSLEDLQTFNLEGVARAVAASRVPIVVGVGHEVDISLADLAADVRAVTPTDAARIVVPDRSVLAREVSLFATSIDRSLARYLALQSDRLTQQTRRLVDYLDITARLETLDQMALQLTRRMNSQLATYQGRVEALARLVTAFDPQATLARGYAIVRLEGKVLTDALTVRAGQSVVVQLAKGQLSAKVEK